MKGEDGNGDDVLALCARLDVLAKRNEFLPENVDLRLNLLQPLEAAVKAWPQFPDSLADRASRKIAKLLWLKTHPERPDPDFLLEQLQDKEPALRITATETLASILVHSPEQWSGSKVSRRFQIALERQRKRESSPTIRFQLSQLLDQLRKLEASGVTPISSFENPYVAGPPLRKSDKFYGRQDILDRIKRTLSAEKATRSLVVQGGRRTGKTSLLYRIRDGALGESFVPTYLDLQGLAGATLHDLVASLIDSIEAALPDGPPSSANGASRLDSGLDFIHLQEFVRNALGRIEPRRLVVMFDEYEVLRDYIRDSDVARQLQHLLEVNEGLFFIFAGSQKVEALDEKNFLLLLDNSQYMKITFLKLVDAYRLIVEPAQGMVDFAQGVPERIQELCGGHPFYIQLICSSLFEIVRGSGTVLSDHVDLALHNFLENPAPHLILSWNALPLDQKIAASALAAQGRSQNPLSASTLALFLRDQKYPIRLGNAELQRALAELRDSDWTERPPEAPDRYRFSMELLRRWVADYRSVWDLLREQERAVESQIPRLRLRGIGFFVDLIALSSVSIGSQILLETISDRFLFRFSLNDLLLPVIVLAYFVLCISASSATPGMLATRLRVLSESGAALQPIRRILFATLVSTPWILLSVFMACLSEETDRMQFVGTAAWISALVLQVVHVGVIHFSKTHRGLYEKLSRATIVRRQKPHLVTE